MPEDGFFGLFNDIDGAFHIGVRRTVVIVCTNRIVGEAETLIFSE